jgi:hypothetical protein
MTEAQIRDLGPAFATYLARFRPCLERGSNGAHFADYCRGLFSDLPRKSVETMALACETAVSTLQAFLKTCGWDDPASSPGAPGRGRGRAARRRVRDGGRCGRDQHRQAGRPDARGSAPVPRLCR